MITTSRRHRRPRRPRRHHHQRVIPRTPPPPPPRAPPPPPTPPAPPAPTPPYTAPTDATTHAPDSSNNDTARSARRPRLIPRPQRELHPRQPHVRPHRDPHGAWTAATPCAAQAAVRTTLAGSSSDRMRRAAPGARATRGVVPRPSRRAPTRGQVGGPPGRTQGRAGPAPPPVPDRPGPASSTARRAHVTSTSPPCSRPTLVQRQPLRDDGGDLRIHSGVALPSHACTQRSVRLGAPTLQAARGNRRSRRGNGPVRSSET